MALLSVLWFGIIVIVFDPTLARAQMPYGVSVEPPTRGAVEPNVRSEVAPREEPAGRRGSAGGSFINIIPTITVSERYDSNILFLQDGKVYDYVTNVSPSARVDYINDFIDSSFTAGISSELYVRNPGLNYVGTNGSIYANLDNLAGRILRGSMFRVTDAVLYTPQMPAFAAPAAGNQVAPEFVRGIQTYRNNALTNSFSLEGGYALTPRFSANVTYSSSIMRFLDDSTVQGIGTLFNTTTESITAGPQYSLSPTDTIGLSYQYQYIAFAPAFQSGSVAQSVTASAAVINGASITWHGSLTRFLSIDISPGISIVSGTGEPAWTGRALALLNLQPTTLSVSYTRGIYPLFYLQSAVLISDAITVMVSHVLTDTWSVGGNISYASNRSITGSGVPGGEANFSSNGFDTSLSASYRFSPTITLQGIIGHSDFNLNNGGTELKVARDTVTLQLRKEWR